MIYRSPPNVPPLQGLLLAWLLLPGQRPGRSKPARLAQKGRNNPFYGLVGGVVGRGVVPG
jgi:hypothetical protein